MGHVPVVLDYLLDDLILLVVEYTGTEVVLHLMLQDGVFLAWRHKDKQTDVQRATSEKGRENRLSFS